MTGLRHSQRASRVRCRVAAQNVTGDRRPGIQYIRYDFVNFRMTQFHGHPFS